MRLRKKHWARPELENCEFFIQRPCTYKEKWRQLFGNEKPIYLELGCGKGTFIAVHGAENPDINYIAIDIKDEVLVLAKRNIEEAYAVQCKSTDNIKLMAQEIGLIETMLGQKDEIDRIYINFCNPWPKDRHKKRRLTHTKQLVKYKVFLKQGAEVWFKTDDDELFMESQEYFKESGYHIEYITYDLHNSGFEGNVRTEHEKMFTDMGMKIKFLIARLEAKVG